MKTLLVIDMLEDFFKEESLNGIRVELTKNINELIEQSRERGIPVVWVRQEFHENLSDAFPVMKKKNIRVTIAGTSGCQILSEFKPSETDLVIVKKRYSAFFQTELESYLKEIDATELILAGINTHACVRMTAIDAYQRDYQVTIPLECVASYDRNHHEVTLSYLDGNIANLVNLDEVWKEHVL